MLINLYFHVVGKVRHLSYPAHELYQYHKLFNFGFLYFCLAKKNTKVDFK